MTAARDALDRLRTQGGDVGYDHQGVVQVFIPDEIDSPALREELRAVWPGLKAEAEREARERAEELRRAWAEHPAAADKRSQAAERPTEFAGPVSAEATQKVDAIREAALACGWTLAGLYRAHGAHPFPSGREYGLVCFLEGDREVRWVCERWIEVIGPPPQRHVLRLYNPDAQHPWMTAAAGERTRRAPREPRVARTRRPAATRSRKQSARI